MAIGSAVQGLSVIAAGGSLIIQPPAPDEWIIHNIYFENLVELYITNGANSFLVDAGSGRGRFSYEVLHATNSIYFTVKNIATASKLIAYDGVRSK